MTYVKYKTKDYAEWQFLVWFNSGDLSFQLKAWQGARFPSLSVWEKFIGTCEKRTGSTVTSKERVVVTARSTDTFTITRSHGWDTALDFDADDYFCLHVNSDVIVDIQDEVSRLDTDKLNISDYQNWTKVYGATSTWNDAYAVTLSPAPSSYQTWMCFRFLADVANTWAATLNVNALGAKTIKKMHDQDLSTWDIEAGQIVVVTYDGTNFQMDSQVATIPTIDINWLPELVAFDESADFVVAYDTSWAWNYKVKWKNAMHNFWDWSDWAIWAWALTITWSNNTYITKQYTTFAPWANTVTVTPTNCIVHIKVQWDCDLTNTTFSFAWKWWQGWAAWSWGWGATVNWSPWDDWLATCGLVDWAWGGWMSATKRLLAFINKSVWFIQAWCWSWGGWGQYDSDLSWSATAWAAWWGCLILEVWWNLTFSGTTMNFNWSNASNVWSWSQWAWGGWGGWCIYILYRWTLSWSPTTNVAWWTGWTWWGVYAWWDWGNSIVATGTDTANSNWWNWAAWLYYISQI